MSFLTPLSWLCRQGLCSNPPCEHGVGEAGTTLGAVARALPGVAVGTEVGGACATVSQRRGPSQDGREEWEVRQVGRLFQARNSMCRVWGRAHIRSASWSSALSGGSILLHSSSARSPPPGSRAPSMLSAAWAPWGAQWALHWPAAISFPGGLLTSCVSVWVACGTFGGECFVTPSRSHTQLLR